MKKKENVHNCQHLSSYARFLEILEVIYTSK